MLDNGVFSTLKWPVIWIFSLLHCVSAVANGDAKHLGVSSCAASTCHGSTREYSDSNILRNEFNTWNELDPHAQAYKTLLTQESKQIAAKLGLQNAHEEAVCLNCHADNVSADHRGPEFKLADGVGCETCHGGAENYIDSHVRDDHQANLEAGLVATEDPVTRAELCVSCHVGESTGRMINHRIMGAGHPRLTFELNTFSSIQPAHYVVDQDYQQRKGVVSEMQLWAVGQVVAAQQFLRNVESMPRVGLFPEFVNMDCLGCHQAMSKLTWSKNPLTRQAPGALRFNDAYLLMAYQISLVVEPERADRFLEAIHLFLNTGGSGPYFPESVRAVRQELTQLAQTLNTSPVTSEQGMEILASLVSIGLTSSHRDYASAEQSAMAINSVLNVLDAQATLSADRSLMLSGISSIFASLENVEDYRPEQFLNGLRQIKRAMD